MTRKQYFAIGAAALLFAILYGVLDAKPRKKNQAVERPAAQQNTEIAVKTPEAMAPLSEAAQKKVDDLKLQIKKSTSDKEKSGFYKALNKIWFESKNYPQAAACAMEVAKLDNTDAAWSVSGASYFLALNQAQNPDERTQFANAAATSFEKAMQLNPKMAEYPVNQALVYAENPPPDNPMKAVLQLRALEAQFPDSAVVYNALGRLAIKTGQWERAIQRLEKALALSPDNQNTICLLADAYAGIGNQAKSLAFRDKCK